MTPIVTYVLHAAKTNPSRQIAVVIPEIVEDRWYNHLLHAQRAAVLKARLYFQGTGSIVVVNVPWYIEKR
jgi:hypothetical protein